MKLVTSILFLFWFQAGAQTNNEKYLRSIIDRNFKSIELIIDTSVLVTTCDHHGNSKTDTINLKFSFDSKKQLVMAEQIFSNKDKFAYYYFDKGKIIMKEYSEEEYVIVKQDFSKITSNCLYNFEGTLIHAILNFGNTLK
jgi:hypothetical protein